VGREWRGSAVITKHQWWTAPEGSERVKAASLAQCRHSAAAAARRQEAMY